MLKSIYGFILLMAVFQQASGFELDQVKSMEATTSLKFRAYVEQNQLPSEATSFSEKQEFPSCQLDYLPTTKIVNMTQFKLVSSEAAYGGARVDTFNLLKNLELHIVKVSSDIKDNPRECALPSHPELCDQNPPMVRVKTTVIEAQDYDSNRWFFICMSNEVDTKLGINPTIDSTEVVKRFGAINLK